MTETATSPRLHAPMPSSSRPPATSSNKSAITPFLSPHLARSPQHAAGQRSQSPNYFAYHGDGDKFNSDSPQHVKNNWSPPSSAVRSVVAASPSVVAADKNPDFDAFRHQSDHNKAFNMGGLNNFKMNIPGQNLNSDSTVGRRTSAPQAMSKSKTESKDVPTPSHRAHLDPSASEMSRSPKRVHSPGSTTDAARRASPASFDSEPARKTSKDHHLAGVPRLKLPHENMNGPLGMMKHRAETLPETNDPASQVFASAERIVNLMSARTEELLLLDLRVSTQYAASHISSALNLCIPTTLLKRPSFDVRKLADTFKDEQQRRRFESWRNSSCIVVYDSSSAALKDATICLNTIKKFRSEGYDGSLYIIKGGFAEFSKRFPACVEHGLDGGNSGVEGEGPKVAPVVGGCPMPETDKPANPFFGNIRQNMDLIGGVGQIALKHPKEGSASAEEHFPAWLRSASEDKDQGKRVSNKFEQIERREKKRMEEALSGHVSFGTPGPKPQGSVQIAGIEKGNKNRYNNIWPFEHSRVRLQGVPGHGCDYFNASHIKASRSNKSYISTQAPVPATFNDFWNVIWQQDVRVVVMLTAEKEGAQVKAHNYWDQKQYGMLHLDFLSEKRASLELSRIRKHRKRPAAMQRHSTSSSNPCVPLATLEGKDDKISSEQPYVIVRKFTLKHSKHPFEPMREITQLQYSGWPDFGAPAHPAHLLGLVEQCDAVARSNDRTDPNEPEGPSKRPMLVHCSAGCGRTGTFCTVDSVIDMLKRQQVSRSTKMDIDSGPTTKKKSNEECDPFFSSQTSNNEEGNALDGVSGAWIDDDDMDLIEKTVEDFRVQRISMVQSLRQYVLCYESIMEWLAESNMLEGKNA